MDWVSVNKQLPCEYKNVLVWVKGEFIDGTHIGESTEWYGIGYFFNKEWNVTCQKHIKNIKVIAWSELLEEYK